MSVPQGHLLTKYLDPRLRKLGLKFPGFGWHTFRRLHLTLMPHRGLTLFDLRRQAGQADVRTIQKYIAEKYGAASGGSEGLPKIVPIRKKVG